MENSIARTGGSIASTTQQENVIFDATQYDFFGKNVVEHDLGELDESMEDTPPVEFEDGAFPSSEKDKGKGVTTSYFVDDLATAFTKMNKINETRSPGDIVDRISSMKRLPMFRPGPRYTRCGGTIKWFSNRKGYGFIKPSIGGEDIFVHYSSVKSDGYIHIWSGTPVEYETVGGSEGKLQAINVTSPGGTLLTDSRYQINGGERSKTGSCSKIIAQSLLSGNIGKYNDIGPCFTCGQCGHLAKNCYLSAKTGAWPGPDAYNTIGQPGDLARDIYGGGYIGGSFAWSNGQLGHVASGFPYGNFHK